MAEARGLIGVNGTIPSVVIHPGESLNDVQVRLTSPGVVAGKVLDERERPVRNIGVVAFTEKRGFAECA